MVTIEAQDEINFLLSALRSCLTPLDHPAVMDTSFWTLQRHVEQINRTIEEALEKYRDREFPSVDSVEPKRPVDDEQLKAIADLHGLRDQIEKQHWLNVHFRAFKLSHEAWQHHILANARGGSRAVNSPAAAVLDDEREDA